MHFNFKTGHYEFEIYARIFELCLSNFKICHWISKHNRWFSKGVIALHLLPIAFQNPQPRIHYRSKQIQTRKPIRHTWHDNDVNASNFDCSRRFATSPCFLPNAPASWISFVMSSQLAIFKKDLGWTAFFNRLSKNNEWIAPHLGDFMLELNSFWYVMNRGWWFLKSNLQMLKLNQAFWKSIVTYWDPTTVFEIEVT